MADKPLTIFDRLLDEEKQEEKPETIFDRLLREEEEQEKEERYREAELTSQTLPPLDLPTEEKRESWADIEREQAAKAREAFGLVGSESREEEEEEAEGNVKKAFLSLKPAPVAEVQIAGDELASAEAWWGNLQRASSGGWDATTAKQKREKMRDFAEAFTQMQSDGVLRQAFEMKLDDASTADQLKIVRALHDSRLWAQDMDYGALTPKADRERMEKLPAEYHQGKVTPPKPPGFWKNFLRMPTLEELEPANLWKGWENASEAILQDVAQAGKTVLTGDWELPGFGAGDYRGRFGSGAEAFAHEVAPEAIPEPDRSEFTKGFGELGRMAPTLQLSYMLGPFAGPVMRTLGLPAIPTAALGTAGAASEFIKTADDPVSSWTVLDNPYINSIEQGIVWATLPAAHKWVSGKTGTYMANLLKRNPKLAKLSSKSKVEQGVISEVAGAGSMLAVLESNPENIIAYLEATPEERKVMVQRFYGRAFGFGLGGAVSGVVRPGPRGRAEPGQRPMGKTERTVEDHVRRQHNLKVAEIMDNGWLMGIVQKSFERHLKIPTEAVPKSEAIETVLSRLEESKSGKTEAVQQAISEMQAKVKAGEFRVPRPKPLEEGLPIPELKESKAAEILEGPPESAAELQRQYEALERLEKEPPTPVEARLVTREEAREAADTQRNIPEDTMLEVTKEIGGSTLSELLEHVGDISNRAQKDAGGGAAKLGMIEKFEKAERQGDLGLEGSIRSDLEYAGAIKYVNERPNLKKLRAAGEGSKEWADAGIERISDIYRDAWADTEYLNKYVDGRLLEIKTILEPYVEAHKLHNKPVTEMGVLGKQLAIDLGEMNFDALRATSKKLRALYDEYNAAKTPEAKDQVWLRRATIEEAPKPPSEGYLKPPEAAERAATELRKQEKLLKVLKKEELTTATEEGRMEVRQEPTEGLTKPLLTDKQMIEAAKVEAAEIDAAAALKGEAKIEEKAEVAAEKREAGEEKIAEAVEGEMFPSAGTARRFHTTILRAKELAKKEKDFDFIRRFDVNPDSAYFTVPSGRWARTIETFDLATADTALAEYGATKGVMRIGDPQEIVGSLIKGRKQQLLLEKANKTGEKADRQAYEDFVQTLANDRTFVGQMMQTYSYFKVSDPVAVRDVYQKAITEAGGPKLTVEEQGTLLDIIKRIEETRKKSEELAEIHRDAELNPKLSEAEINKAFEKADDAMLDWERAVVEQINLVGDKMPKLAVDMIVAQWQGNFLTPTTHAVNVYGNIFPMAPRAAARTGSRVYEAADRFLWGKSREMKLMELEKLQEKSPDPIRGETIKRLQQLTDPMEQSKLIPERLLHLYAKGITSGTGAERVWSAWKATRGKDKKGRRLEAFMTEFKRFKTPVGGDMLSSLVMGSGVNLYETGTMNMSNMTRPVDAFRAWQRLFGGKKSSKNVETVSKDLFEAIFGMPPTVHFKFLMAGDVIFRNKEMMRLIDEQAAVRKWSPEKRARAIRNPKLMFTEKEMAQNRNRSAMASFQHETGWTEATQKLNKWLSSGGAGRKALYLGWRGQTPYQKTLMNVTHEIFQFSPFGAPYTMGRGVGSGLKGAWRGYSEEGAKGIPRGIQESYMPTKENLQIAGKNLVGLSIAMGAYKWLREDGIVSPDMNPVMSDPTDTAKVRYLTEETFHHGFINMSGLRRKFDNEDARWKEGDWVVDARRLGPIGHMLLSGAAVQRGLEKMPEKERRKIEADWDKLIAHELTGSAVYANRYFWNQTMATGVKDFMQSLWWIKEGEGAGKMQKKLVKDFTSIFLPNTAQWLTKVDSPYKQSFKPSTVSEALKVEWETKSRSMFDRSRMEKIRVRDEKGKVLEEDVPVGLTGYPIIVDLWGSPLETMGEGRVLGVPLASWKTATWEKTAQGREDFWDRFMAKTFNVVDFKKSGKIADPYSGEVYRLMMKTGKGDVVPPMYSDKITVGEGKDRRRYKLNQDQYAYKSIMEGRYRLDGVSELVVSGARQMQRRWDTKGGWGFKQYMESSEFGRSSDEEKIKELQRIYKRARTAGVAALVEVGLMDNKSVRADLAMRKFNINPDNIPLTDDQLIEGPSGMRE